MTELKTEFGSWLTMGDPTVAEIANLYDFDWLLFDMEHGHITESDLLANFHAISNKGIKIIVRIGKFDPALIAKILDLGAAGIMMPHVHSAAVAKECLSAMYYPPNGLRGYSSSVRAYKYGNHPPLDLALVKPLFIAQIEEVDGVQNAEEIANVEGVDVLFVGPADLKLSLSAHRATLSFDEAIQVVLRATQQANKKAGILTRNVADIQNLKKQGFSFIGVNSDTAILKAGYQQITDEIKKEI